jgi:hypothetical protein
LFYSGAYRFPHRLSQIDSIYQSIPLPARMFRGIFGKSFWPPIFVYFYNNVRRCLRFDSPGHFTTRSTR